MGVIVEGRNKIRWIRLLIVVLALTASRSNFPLSKLARSSSKSDCAALSARTPRKAKKSEGVTPSRRNVETRRTDSLQNAPSDSAHHPDALVQFGDLLGADRSGHRPDPELIRSAAIAQPDYLQFFRQAAHVSTLPPPV